MSKADYKKYLESVEYKPTLKFYELSARITENGGLHLIRNDAGAYNAMTIDEDELMSLYKWLKTIGLEDETVS